MHTENLVATIKTFHQARRPLLILGQPAIGKSALVHAASSALGTQIIDLRVPYYESSDFHGFPYVENGRACFAPIEALPTEGEGILFLDELTAARRDVQLVLYQLILDRKIGKYTLPPGWSIVAAGNRSTDGAIAEEMSSALATRIQQVTFVPDQPAWLKWAAGAGVHPMVLAYVQTNPAKFNDFTPDDPAYPTPRTWQMTSDNLHLDLADQDRLELNTNTIGTGVATELEAWIRTHATLPKLPEILMNPDTALVPPSDKPDQLFMIASSLAHSARPENIDRIATYCERLPIAFQASFYRTALRREPMNANTRSAIIWQAAHADLIGAA